MSRTSRRGVRRTALAAMAAALIAALGAPLAQAGTTEIVLPEQYPGMGPWPQTLAVGGPSGHVLVGFDRGGVQERDAAGALIRTHALPPGYLYGVTWDASGNLYTSQWSDAVSAPVLRKTSPAGAELWSRTLADGERPSGLSIAGGVLWGSNNMDTVTAYDAATGEPGGSFAATVHDLVALPNGNVLTAQHSGGITERDAAGAIQRSIPAALPPVTAMSDGTVVAMRSDRSTIPSVNSLVAWRWDGTYSTVLPLQGRWATDLAAAADGSLWALSSNADNQRVLLHLDPRTPDVRLSASASLMETGQTVTFDASRSSVPFGSPARFEWDLDGNGTFETDSGTAGTITHAYAQRGVRTVTVRVTAPAGGTSTAATTVDVRADSPDGPPGVSVNSGAQYTNNPVVTVHMRWPTYAQEALLSNDGGFFPATRVAVDSTMTWTLDSSGPERLPKTIYVRFYGGQAGAETYQDDIILDQTRPVVGSATGAVGTSSRIAARVALGAKRTYKLVLKATDATSGVARMQVTYRKSRPGTWKTYKRKIRFKSPTPKIFVRVMDRAGNVSGWKRVKVA